MRISRFLLILVVLLAMANYSWSADGVIVLVDVKVKAGNTAAVITAFKRSQASCKQWSGCRQFDITVDQDNERQLYILEHWDSVAQQRQEMNRITSSDTFVEFRQLLAEDLSFHYLRRQ